MLEKLEKIGNAIKTILLYAVAPIVGLVLLAIHILSKRREFELEMKEREQFQALQESKKVVAKEIQESKDAETNYKNIRDSYLSSNSDK